MKNRMGKNNPNWKGDKVKYAGLHLWVSRRIPKPKVCTNCKIKPPNDLANVDGKYTRNLSDWEWLCRSCHMKKDGRMNNLWKGIPNGKKHPRGFLGRKHSAETRMKMGLSRLGNQNARKV